MTAVACASNAVSLVEPSLLTRITFLGLHFQVTVYQIFELARQLRRKLLKTSIISVRFTILYLLDPLMDDFPDASHRTMAFWKISPES